MENWESYRRKSGLVIVLSGPSGVGKDVVLQKLLKKLPGISKCVTMTTRTPRDSEADGEDYNFLDITTFRDMVEHDEFLEYADVHGNLYGTPRRIVEEHIHSGRDIVLKIDVQGGLRVKKHLPDAVMIFLVPPSIQELERRLRGRMTDTAEAVERRLLGARNELSQLPHYQYMVENNTIDRAVDELRSIISAEHNRILPRE